MDARQKVYGTSAQNYFDRALAEFRKATRQGLIYAALETRMGTESRIHDYIELKDDVSNSVRKKYELNKTWKATDAAEDWGNRTFAALIKEVGRSEVLLELNHTPVVAELKDLAARLGDSLHVTRKRPQKEDKWWVDLENRVASALYYLEFALRGDLLEVPKMREGKLTIKTTEPMLHEVLNRVGDQVTIAVEWRDGPPPPPPDVVARLRAAQD